MAQPEKNESSVSIGGNTVLVLGILLAALIISASVLMAGNAVGDKLAKVTGQAVLGNNNNNNQQNNQPTNNPTTTTTLKQLADQSPAIGDPNAPVTIVEFTDFSCPFCAAADGENQEVIDYLKGSDPTWTAPIPAIMEDYVKTGKVRFAVKYFPGHGSGMQAHLVGWCTYEQNADAFWKFGNLAYANQSETNDVEKMKAYAVQSGADATKLTACLDSKKYDSRIQSETTLGRSMGVSGTPGFFIGKSDGSGQLISGAASYPKFKSQIDALLQ